MNCPTCLAEQTRVVDSRIAQKGATVRRRRKCLSCDHRFSTLETLELLRIQVRKRNGSLESFDREKLLVGLQRACEKRPVSEQTLFSIIATVERDLARIQSLATASGTLPEINSQDIGELVLSQLQSVDPVAYVRFASVYRGFSSLREFEKALKEAKKPVVRPHSG